jgi:hypothetical protein
MPRNKQVIIDHAARIDRALKAHIYLLGDRFNLTFASDLPDPIKHKIKEGTYLR